MPAAARLAAINGALLPAPAAQESLQTAQEVSEGVTSP